MKAKIFIGLLVAFSARAAETKTKILWKEWYVVTASNQVQGYYSEEAEVRPKENQLAISQRWMERDEGITESYIGSVAKNNDTLTPVAFYVEKKMPNKAVSVDGRIKNGKVLIQYKANGTAQKVEDAEEKGTIWSNFLALSLIRHKKKSGVINFLAVIEDAKDGNYNPQPGKAVVTNEKKKIQSLLCQKFNLNFQNIQSEWWISESGKVCEIYIPDGEMRIGLSTEKEALKLFQGQKK